MHGITLLNGHLGLIRGFSLVDNILHNFELGDLSEKVYLKGLVVKTSEELVENVRQQQIVMALRASKFAILA